MKTISDHFLIMLTKVFIKDYEDFHLIQPVVAVTGCPSSFFLSAVPISLKSLMNRHTEARFHFFVGWSFQTMQAFSCFSLWSFFIMYLPSAKNTIVDNISNNFAKVKYNEVEWLMVSISTTDV